MIAHRNVTDTEIMVLVILGVLIIAAASFLFGGGGSTPLDCTNDFRPREC